jgi:hypothetical protein
MQINKYTSVWKVRGLNLLLRVGSLWRCCDGLFFAVPHLTSDALLTTLHPLLENYTDRWSLRNFLPRSSLFMVGKAQKSHGARSGPYGGCSNGVPPIHFFQTEHVIQFIPRSLITYAHRGFSWKWSNRLIMEGLSFLMCAEASIMRLNSSYLVLDSGDFGGQAVVLCCPIQRLWKCWLWNVVTCLPKWGGCAILVQPQLSPNVERNI